MNENSRVLVSIIGTQVEPGGKEKVIQFMTEGAFQKEGNVSRLSYRDAESQDDSEMFIETDGLGVSVCHEGGMPSSLYLQKGQPSEVIYNTPLGPMRLRAMPSEVRVRMEENSGEVRLAYDINIQGHYAGQNFLDITYWKE